jgi:PD-(D/E)XK nuclease superfamily
MMISDDARMSRNVIDIFARGNQELFHSAFLAWLMDDHESHGLGKSFRSRIISRLGENCGYDPNGEYKVATESRSGESRFDIILWPTGATRQGKGLIFENKIKSYGNHLQLDKYKGAGYDVAVLALLPETLDEDTKQRYQVLTYKTIRDVLNEVPLNPEDPHQFLVIQYRSFLERTLATYSAISDYCSGTVESDAFFERLGRAVEGLTFGDNDIRTFNYFYYYRLAEFIKYSARDLAFGDCAYDAAEKQKANRVLLSWKPSFTNLSTRQVGRCTRPFEPFRKKISCKSPRGFKYGSTYQS